MIEEKKLHPRPAPPRYGTLSPFRIERSSRCVNCGRCAETCLYGCHERSESDPRVMADPKRGCCRNCFACILTCPRRALSMRRDEAFDSIGDRTFTPPILRAIYDQASEGKIPVSGAGYGGPFDGSGFDGLWTDMSEIVRPTRDGIHGREHISTTVYLGRMVSDLCGMSFDAEGSLKSLIPPTREIPIPVLFGIPPFPTPEAVQTATALAASALKTYTFFQAGAVPDSVREYFNHLCIRLRKDEIESYQDLIRWATVVEIEPGEGQIAAIARARAVNPHLLTILQVRVEEGVERRVLDLARRGAETVHLSADRHGQGPGGLSLLEGLRRTHLALVEKGLRDQITLIASGGIAAAEHVPKTIILGADAVVADTAVLASMECTVCGDCERGEPCPRDLSSIDVRWGATRIINLMLAWKDQLLEVLGAMGIRDVRRLRGETGRAIFAADARNDFAKRLGTATRAAAFPGKSPERGLPSQPAPHRFNSEIGYFRVIVDPRKCTACGICAACCKPGVFQRTDGRGSLDEPRHERCIGPTCRENDWCCLRVCPYEALEVVRDSVETVLGDRRWTPDMLRLTWQEAKTGRAARNGGRARTGNSGGGFDALRLAGSAPGESVEPASVALTLPLNRRAEGPRIAIPLPIYGGGMSYGSVSLQVMLGRAMAAKALGTFSSTGEGGYPEPLVPYRDHVITQVATGLFGVREETILGARLVEFKYAQGAKPGLGGHLLGKKNTPEVAGMREAVPWTSLFSPFPFHSVYSVEDHKKHLDWLRAINPDLVISVKVSTPADVDMVAVGSYYAGANIIHLDGAYGGTGAAPDIAKKNIAQPIEYAITQAHDFLTNEGIRDEVVLMASGGVRTPEDVLKAIALGADGCVIGTAELVAVDCVRCGNCERDRGCPIGIATTDPGLAPQLRSEWVRDRIVGLYSAWSEYMRERLAGLKMRSAHELRGRRDLLTFEGGQGGSRA